MQDRQRCGTEGLDSCKLWFHPEVKNDFHARLAVSISFREDVDALKSRSNGNLLAGRWQYPCWWKDAAVEARVIDTGRSLAQHFRQKLWQPWQGGFCNGNKPIMLECLDSTFLHPSDLLAPGWEDPPWAPGAGSLTIEDLKTIGVAECWASHFGRRCISYYEWFSEYFYNHLRWGACRSS